MEPKTPEKPAVPADLIALLEEHFSPAPSVREATSKLTTAEVFSLIERHAPGAFFHGYMQPALKQLGYKTVMVGEDIRWLLTAR